MLFPLASSAMSKAVPDLDAIGDLAITAAKNSRRLLHDAELLLSRGRWPTAHAIAVLAFEEAGKAWLCVVAMLMPDDARDEFPFGDLDWDHRWKLGAAHGMAAMLAFIRADSNAPPAIMRAADELEALARQDNEAKKRGFYADCADGVVWDPAGVSKSDAARTVAAVSDVLDHGGVLADPKFITWLAAMPEELKPERDAFWDRLLSGWEQNGNDGIASAFMEFVGEIGSVEEMRQMFQDDARRLAISGPPKPRRVQPRKPPPRSRRSKVR